ncbi:MAG: ATP-binding protein, partial [Bacilli bacterium]
YALIENGDKIAVCISGGKDSFLLAKCLQELKHHGKIDFALDFIVMDPGYNNENITKIKANLKLLNIDAYIFKTDIFAVCTKITSKPCYMCAKMRRGYLYNKAKLRGCNKIALGHHFNDVVETILMNQIFNGSYSSMMPKLKSSNFAGMELIRPLYLIKEEHIILWAKYNNLTFIDCACSITKKQLGQRKKIKKLINDMKTIFPDADKGIFNGTGNVNLNTIIGGSKNGEKFNFLDDYCFKK